MTVSDIVLPDDGGIDAIYKQLQCDVFDVVRLPGGTGDGIFVDDEGLMNLKFNDEGECETGFFYVMNPAGTEPMAFIAGRGLVLGCDDEGESKSPTIDADILQSYIVFVNKNGRNAAAKIAERMVGGTTVCFSQSELEECSRTHQQTLNEAMKLTQ